MGAVALVVKLQQRQPVRVERGYQRGQGEH